MGGKKEYVFSFAKTNDAIQAEYILGQSGIAVRVMPLPPEIKAGCGICLRIDFDDKIKEDATNVFSQNHLHYQNLFIREQTEWGSKSTYSEVE